MRVWLCINRSLVTLPEANCRPNSAVKYKCTLVKLSTVLGPDANNFHDVRQNCATDFYFFVPSMIPTKLQNLALSNMSSAYESSRFTKKKNLT